MARSAVLKLTINDIYISIKDHIHDQAILDLFRSEIRNRLFTNENVDILYNDSNLNTFEVLKDVCSFLSAHHPILAYSFTLLSLHQDDNVAKPTVEKPNSVGKVSYAATLKNNLSKLSSNASPSYPLAKVKKELREKLLEPSGVYRYEKGLSHRGLYLYHVVPLSLCSKIHQGPPCTPSGWYPHITKVNWTKYTAKACTKLALIPTRFERLNPLRSELNLLSYRYQRWVNRCGNQIRKNHIRSEPDITARNSTEHENMMEPETVARDLIMQQVPEPSYVSDEQPQPAVVEVTNSDLATTSKNKKKRKKAKSSVASSLTGENAGPTPGYDEETTRVLLELETDLSASTSKLGYIARWNKYIRYLMEKEIPVPIHMLRYMIAVKPSNA